MVTNNNEHSDVVTNNGEHPGVATNYDILSEVNLAKLSDAELVILYQNAKIIADDANNKITKNDCLVDLVGLVDLVDFEPLDIFSDIKTDLVLMREEIKRRNLSLV
jgi:hypothetical protein